MTNKTSNPLPIYTVMPDFGWTYLWVIHDGDETHGVGGAFADHTGWSPEYGFSPELHAEFAAWQIEFETTGSDVGKKWSSERWDAYHERGLALARCLKVELGDAARVVYERPCEDPRRRHNERREVLQDGLIRQMPGRAQLHRWPLRRLVERIVSGGQTGVDRAALDWAIGRRIPHGGWCPKGRLAEDGPIPRKYRLKQTVSKDYAVRTKRNVADSDGTLILNSGDIDGGTLATARFAKELSKPLATVQLDREALDASAERVLEWLRADAICTLNVAGPRESKRPGMYGAALKFLDALHADR